jgi:predicted PurR-regulated permease PerM
MLRLKELFSDRQYLKISLYIIFTVSLLYILYFIIKNFDIIFNSISMVIGSILTALSPLFIGLIIAYLLSPLVDIIDKNFMSKIFFSMSEDNEKYEKRLQLRRTISILVTFLLAIILLITIIYALAYMLVGNIVFEGITSMVENITLYFTRFEDILNGIFEKMPNSGLEERLQNFANNFTERISDYFSAEAVIKIITNIGGSLIKIALGIVVAIYLIKDKDYFIRLWRKSIHIFCPMGFSARLNEVLYDIDIVFSRFLRGQLLDALIVAIVISIVLTIIRLDFAVLLGCFAGITNIIPYFGPIFGAIPAIIVALLSGGFSKAIVTLIAFIVIQQIDGNFIYPKVVGSSTGLHPLFVLLAVTFGGYFWGILGMILAVPIAACIKQYIVRKVKDMEV